MPLYPGVSNHCFFEQGFPSLYLYLKDLNIVKIWAYFNFLIVNFSDFLNLQVIALIFWFIINSLALYLTSWCLVVYFFKDSFTNYLRLIFSNDSFSFILNVVLLSHRYPIQNVLTYMKNFSGDLKKDQYLKYFLLWQLFKLFIGEFNVSNFYPIVVKKINLSFILEAFETKGVISNFIVKSLGFSLVQFP